MSPLDPGPSNAQLSGERGELDHLPLHLLSLQSQIPTELLPAEMIIHILSTISAALPHLPPSSLACAHMILLGTGLSLTAHFVKSVSFVCDDCPLLVFPEQLASRTAVARRMPVCSQNTLNPIQAATFVHPSSLGFLSPCPGLSLIPPAVPRDLYSPFDK